MNTSGTSGTDIVAADGRKTLALDLPRGLILTPLEEQILLGITNGKSNRAISADLGIPLSSISSLLKRTEVKEFVQDMVDARNLALKMELPNLLAQIIQDKIDTAIADGVKLGDTTKKDIVDVVKELSGLLKNTSSTAAESNEDGFTKVYNQINNIQNNY